VGLCDEYPAIYYPDNWDTYGYDGVLEPDMVICVESYVGRVGGREGVKLEEQVLITDDGPELLSSYPSQQPGRRLPMSLMPVRLNSQIRRSCQDTSIIAISLMASYSLTRSWPPVRIGLLGR